ncbi:hypothetical protein TNCT_565871 [Trichonephila clavata]|uniref:Uncharacterized protein n=1 Tax=Trichonephila clavata TaxID=2740835 RepID=A0A8X6IKM5_TRICU|nr:hypothetical protein TNCT_565871 [Trichonephila clavata]
MQVRQDDRDVAEGKRLKPAKVHSLPFIGYNLPTNITAISVRASILKINWDMYFVKGRPSFGVCIVRSHIILHVLANSMGLSYYKYDVGYCNTMLPLSISAMPFRTAANLAQLLQNASQQTLADRHLLIFLFLGPPSRGLFKVFRGPGLVLLVSTWDWCLGPVDESSLTLSHFEISL